MCDCVFPDERVVVPQTRGGKVLEYDRWKDMIRRCYNPAHHKFKNYGERGIKVCLQWQESFQIYLKDIGERPGRMSLDRKENNGHYCPHNTRWASQQTQMRNREISKKSILGLTKKYNGFQVNLAVEGRTYYVGKRKTEREAIALYRLNYFEWFGRYPEETP